MEKKIIYLEDRRDFHNRIESEKTANCLVANELSSVDNALSMMEQCLGHNGFLLRHIDMTAVIEAMMRPIWEKSALSMLTIFWTITLKIINTNTVKRRIFLMF